jgi:hypothetical protein
MVIWLLLGLGVVLGLHLERRRSAEFWARALAFHEARHLVWSAAAERASSATVAAARASGLRALKDSLRSDYTLESIASGLLSPDFDVEVEAVFDASSTGRWDPARARAYLAEARADLAHAREMQGGEIDWSQLLRYGWPGALLFAVAAGTIVVITASRPDWIVLAAVLGFFLVGVERDRFWTWFGDRLKGAAEVGAASLLP